MNDNNDFHINVFHGNYKKYPRINHYKRITI